MRSRGARPELLDRLGRDSALVEARNLVKQAHAVTKAAVAMLSNDAQRGVVDVDFFLCQRSCADER